MIDPVAFTVFGLSVHWYGLSYVIGFLFAYWFVSRFAKDFGFKKSVIQDVFLWVMGFSVVGGRLFYIVFYNVGSYLADPLSVFAVWEGGMSIHGGIFGAFVALWYCSRKYDLTFYKLSDLFVLPAGFGLALGRLANFVNQELVGKVTTSSFGVVFDRFDSKLRWPYQIFASFKNLVVFEILLFLFWFRKLKPGVLTAWFLILYSFGRFFVDFVRVPTIDLGIVSLGQVLSLVYGFWGVWILVKVSKI